MGLIVTQDHPTTTSESTQQDSDTALSKNAALYRLSMAIQTLASPSATDEDFLTAMDIEAALVRVTREYRDRLKEAAIDYINKHGEVETPTCRFYVGNSKTTNCRDTGRAVGAVLEATGGDLDRLLDCLTSQPLKHGACRAVLGDEWDQHFETITKQDIKTGKPAKEIKKALPGAGKDEEEWAC